MHVKICRMWAVVWKKMLEMIVELSFEKSCITSAHDDVTVRELTLPEQMHTQVTPRQEWALSVKKFGKTSLTYFPFNT